MKFLLTIILFASSSFADDYGKRLRPLYEFGAGITHARFPNYPGASSTKSVTLPFPTALYRGDVLRLKREEGARGIFYRGERVELDISFDGTLPSDGEDTQIREGMNKLDALIEVGPRFLYNILKVSPTNPWDLDFHLAGRIAVSSGFFENVFSRGLVINPFFTVRRVSLFTDDDLFGAFAGVKFASQDWHSYYYAVEEKFSTFSGDACIQDPFNSLDGSVEIFFSTSNILMFG